jgi:23S rRNA pseudouridine1911/1915/1917 synthase
MKVIKLKNETKERLDKALVEALQITRSKAQELIIAQAVRVNDKIPTAHLKVSASDRIELTLPKEKKSSAKKIKAPLLEIIYEDGDVIVVNKPAGLLTHGAPNVQEPTLVDALIKHDKKIKNVGDDKKRAGIVHRLDRDASGVLIVAKNNAAFADLKAQFQNRQTRKIYTVLVHGKVSKDHDTLTWPIARSTTRKGKMAARPNSQAGREAITHYDVVARYPHVTLLDVRIETGRTHQIRAHMFALGHHVVGDKLYFHKGVKGLGLDRLFLHAKELTITLPSGEEKTFSAPLPLELQSVLNALK